MNIRFFASLRMTIRLLNDNVVVQNDNVIVQNDNESFGMTSGSDAEGIESAINHRHCSGHCPGCIGCKPMQGSKELLRLEETPYRSMRKNSMRPVGQASVRIGKQCPVLVGQKETRSNRVDPQAFPEFHSQLCAQPLGPVGHRRLGDTVACNSSG